MCSRPAGMWACGAGIVRSEGPLALYKGLVPALAGIAPYAAINFASYDGLKAWAYGAGSAPCTAHSAVCRAGFTEVLALRDRERKS